MRRLWVVMCVLSLGLAACGGDKTANPTEDTKSWQNRSYKILNEGSFSLTDQALVGNASILFTQPLGHIDSNKNFKVGFLLLDQGSVELRSFTNTKLDQGVTLRFSRTGDNLYLTLIAGKSETSPRLLSGINADGYVVLSVDVHNSESPTHILVWEPNITNATDDNALFNSDADATTPGRGVGQFWGLVLNNATVNLLDVTKARFGH